MLLSATDLLAVAECLILLLLLLIFLYMYDYSHFFDLVKSVCS